MSTGNQAFVFGKNVGYENGYFYCIHEAESITNFDDYGVYHYYFEYLDSCFNAEIDHSWGMCKIEYEYNYPNYFLVLPGGIGIMKMTTNHTLNLFIIPIMDSTVR